MLGKYPNSCLGCQDVRFVHLCCDQLETEVNSALWDPSPVAGCCSEATAVYASPQTCMCMMVAAPWQLRLRQSSCRNKQDAACSYSHLTCLKCTALSCNAEIQQRRTGVCCCCCRHLSTFKQSSLHSRQKMTIASPGSMAAATCKLHRTESDLDSPSIS